MFLPDEDRLCFKTAGGIYVVCRGGARTVRNRGLYKTYDSQAKSLETKGVLGLFELKKVDRITKEKADYLER